MAEDEGPRESRGAATWGSGTAGVSGTISVANSLFGPAVNVNTTRSVAWNTARACTLIKPCMADAKIPVHPIVGMGGCGVPMTAFPPHDAGSRASRAMVDILKIDGL